MSPVIQRIVSIMRERGVTQVKLTKDLNISATTISDWKKGKGRPQVDTLIKIAEYFNVSLDVLLLGEARDVKFQISNTRDTILIKRFHNLSIEGQNKILSYLDFVLMEESKAEKDIIMA